MKEAIRHLKLSDPVLREIIERVGEYRIEFREPDFETLVKSITFQQLSGRVASVIFGRLASAVGGKVTPESVLKLRPSRMRALGFSTQKTAYIRDLARHARSGTVTFEDLLELPDEQVIERLTQVKGIGVWTVHMFLIFALQAHGRAAGGRPGDSCCHSQGVRPGRAADARRDGGAGAEVAPLLHGGELVSLAQPGTEREFVADNGWFGASLGIHTSRPPAECGPTQARRSRRVTGAFRKVRPAMQTRNPAPYEGNSHGYQ